MALNLISSYGSDEDSDTLSTESSPKEPSNFLEAEHSETTVKEKSFFFGGDECASSGEEEHDQLKQSERLQKPAGSTRRLPSAGSVLKGNHVGSSIFSSEREQEDLAQQLTLSQHVPLTEKVEARKKPVCRAFQRGECRRGNKCRFAHPVAPQTPKDAAIVAGAAKMYSADDVFAKKAKIA